MRPGDSALARKGASTLLSGALRPQPDRGWLPGRQARAPQQSAGPWERDPASWPGSPASGRSHLGSSQVRCRGWRERGESRGATAVLATTAPQGPLSGVSSDRGGWRRPRRGPESLAWPPVSQPPASGPGWKAGLGELARRRRRRRLPNCSLAGVVGRPDSASMRPRSSVAETLAPQRRPHLRTIPPARPAPAVEAQASSPPPFSGT